MRFQLIGPDLNDLSIPALSGLGYYARLQWTFRGPGKKSSISVLCASMTASLHGCGSRSPAASQRKSRRRRISTPSLATVGFATSPPVHSGVWCRTTILSGPPSGPRTTMTWSHPSRKTWGASLAGCGHQSIGDEYKGRLSWRPFGSYPGNFGERVSQTGWCLSMPAMGVLFSLNPEHPDGDDGADHGEAADGPAGEIGRAVDLGPVDHGVMPLVVHSEPPDSSASCQISPPP